MTNAPKKRELKYEALRMVAMFLIVGSHFLASDNWAIHTDASLQNSWAACFHNTLIMFGQVGVCLFVLISSYFLSSKTVPSGRRVLKLWLHVEIYSVGGLFVYVALMYLDAFSFIGSSSITVRSVVVSLFPVLGCAYWFISAFFVVTIASPYINTFLNQTASCKCIKFLVGLVFVVFIWRLINPQVSYYNDVLYLLTIYVAGYCIRRFDCAIPRTSFLSCFFVVSICFACCLFGTKLFTSDLPFIAEWGYSSYILIAGSNASPLFSFVSAVAIFNCVRCNFATLDTGLSRFSSFSCLKHIRLLVERYASATLGVYLIHENMFIKQLIWGTVFGGTEPIGLINKAGVAVIWVSIVYAFLLITSRLIDIFIVEPIWHCALDRFNI